MVKQNTQESEGDVFDLSDSSNAFRFVLLLMYSISSINIKNRRYWRIDQELMNNLPTGHLNQSATAVHLSSVMD